jgi:hypothetical protein
MLGQIELTWVQNGPVGFGGKKLQAKKQYARCIMRILCPSDFKELTENW